MLHLTTDVPKPADCSNQSTTKHFYQTSSTYFVLPHTAQYDPASASLAHSRTLVFLRKHLGGPFFDIEAIWDEHTYFEFEVRSVAKTMGTMVVSVICRPCVLPRLRVTFYLGRTICQSCSYCKTDAQ